jgi:dihydrofolate synthase/folylpolyglutamate synthase
LGELLDEVVTCAESRLGHSPTYFEAVTAAAFLWFAAERVDLAVVEVGLGGRLDATNLCEPILSLVTSISLEHRELLGSTPAEIAREKAGILRAGRPALSWVEDPQAAAALREAAADLGAGLRAAESEVTIAARAEHGWAGQAVCLVTPVARRELWTRLLGRHQVKNLGLATRAAELLAEAAIAAGAAACNWPGRAEVVALADGRRVLLDAAHNAEGAAALAELLGGLGAARGSHDLVFGVLREKSAGEMLGQLSRWAGRVVLTTPPNPRARPPEELQAMLSGMAGVSGPPGAGGPEVLVEPAPAAALERALGLGAETVVVCGSIFLVGELRRRLRELYGTPPPVDVLWDLG